MENGNNLEEEENVAQPKGFFQWLRRKSGINYRQHRLYQGIQPHILSSISMDLVYYLSLRIFASSSGWIGQCSLQKWLNYLFFLNLGDSRVLTAEAVASAHKASRDQQFASQNCHLQLWIIKYNW